MRNTMDFEFRVWDEVEKLMYHFNFYTIEKPNTLGGQILRVCRDGIVRYFPLHRKDIMQYTGLKDKNGKKIFDGDIIRWQGFKKPAWQEVKYDIDKGILLPKQVTFTEKIEVIGNIYQNPKLNY